MNSFTGKTEHLLQLLEKRFGLFFSSLIVGVCMLCLAMIYVEPSFSVSFHGLGFSALSSNPFDLNAGNPLQYRILSPLLGYLLFLRGKLFFILPLLFAAFLPAAVFYQYRKKDFNGVEAALMAGLVAFSSTLLIPITSPAYTDTVTFFFLFLSFAHIKQKYKSALLFSLALLNHESSVVVLPGLMLYSFLENKRSIAERVTSVLLLLVACMPYLAYRWWISSQTEVLYSVNFYLDKQNIQTATKYFFHFLPAAVFYAFKLFWFFPLYACAVFLMQRNFSRIMLVLLVVCAVISQLIIAFDYTRMITLAFPIILISAEQVRGWWGTEKFIRFSLWLTVCNFFVLQYYVTHEGLTALFPWLYNLLAAWCGHPYT